MEGVMRRVGLNSWGKIVTKFSQIVCKQLKLAFQRADQRQVICSHRIVHIAALDFQKKNVFTTSVATHLKRAIGFLS